MKAQTSHAVNPESLTPNAFATAAARPITARFPLSKYLKGGNSCPVLIRFTIDFAAYAPPCIATWARPGKGFPERSRDNARSPITNMFRKRGNVRLGPTLILPLLSVSAPALLASALPRGGAATPPAQITVLASKRDSVVL